MPALPETTKNQIRKYLGAPLVTTNANTAIEMALGSLDGASSDVQTVVTGLVSDLAAIDTKLIDSHSRTKVLTIGNLGLPGQNEAYILKSEGRRLVGRLAAAMGVSAIHDVFSGAVNRPNNVLMMG